MVKEKLCSIVIMLSYYWNAIMTDNREEEGEQGCGILLLSNTHSQIWKWTGFKLNVKVFFIDKQYIRHLLQVPPPLPHPKYENGTNWKSKQMQSRCPKIIWKMKTIQAKAIKKYNVIREKQRNLC